MPDKTGRFTSKEKQFVAHFANTGDATYAAAKAGYSQPDSSGSKLSSNPLVAAEARRRTMLRLVNEILPMAAERHASLLADPETKGQTLNRAIEMAYKYGLAAAEGGEAKEPGEMTAEELARARDRLLAELAGRAKPVLDLEPAPAQPGVFE